MEYLKYILLAPLLAGAGLLMLAASVALAVFGAFTILSLLVGAAWVLWHYWFLAIAAFVLSAARFFSERNRPRETA